MLEETGLTVANVRQGPMLNVCHAEAGYHYLVVFMVAQVADAAAAAQNLEPDRCAGWLWAPWTKLPTPLFATLQALVDTQFSPF